MSQQHLLHLLVGWQNGQPVITLNGRLARRKDQQVKRSDVSNASSNKPNGQAAGKLVVKPAKLNAAPNALYVHSAEKPVAKLVKQGAKSVRRNDLLVESQEMLSVSFKKHKDLIVVRPVAKSERRDEK